jgi:acyl-CoA dehydrogenase
MVVVLGVETHGFAVAMWTLDLDLFWPSVSAFAVSMARAALDATVESSGQRVAFGGLLTRQQTVSHTLAKVAARRRRHVFGRVSAGRSGRGTPLLR